MPFNSKSKTTNEEDLYYYTKDVKRVFGLEVASVAHWVKIGAIPEPEIVKEKHQKVRRWLKSDIDKFLGIEHG